MEEKKWETVIFFLCGTVLCDENVTSRNKKQRLKLTVKDWNN